MKEIKALIEKHGSLQKAADAIGIKKPTLHAYATGFRKVAVSRIADVSKKTGIPREKLRPDIYGKGS